MIIYSDRNNLNALIVAVLFSYRNIELYHTLKRMETAYGHNLSKVGFVLDFPPSIWI